MLKKPLQKIAMEFSHTSVLLNESIESLQIKSGGIYVDGTLGGGGHARLICEKISQEGTFIGIDKDVDAIESAKEKLANYKCKKIYVNRSFEDIKAILKDERIAEIDGAILDLGVSSWQLDNAERGFSYMQDGPLDMRMEGSQSETGSSLTAEQVINEYSEESLKIIIQTYGEERWAKRIANFIVKARETEPIRTTGRLVEIIKNAIPASARREGPHPAKRSFQAIRIEVNDELGTLKRSIGEYIDVLGKGGRLAIISFHSLEDRIVKETFNKRENPCECPKDIPICVCGKVADVKKVTKKPILPSDLEVEENSRSRSAKLRVVEKV